MIHKIRLRTERIFVCGIIVRLPFMTCRWSRSIPDARDGPPNFQRGEGRANCKAAAITSGSSPNPASQCTSGSLRNQVICRLAKRRVACWIFSDHFSGRAAVGNLIAQIRVADELKRFRVRGHAHFDEAADFVHPAGGNHGVHARIDFGVEAVARGREADFRYGVACEAASAAAMDFAYCFSGEDAHFNRANDFLSVARSDPARPLRDPGG